MIASVNVIIPTCKRAYNLSKAVNSVLSQTYKNMEIIVVDDNNDGDEYRKETEKAMEKFTHLPNVKYIKHSQNRNGAAARNTGIKNSNAEFVAFLDDDDLWSPRKIEKQIEMLNSKDSSYSGVACFHIRRYKNFTYKAIHFKENENGNYFFELFTNKKSMPTSTLLFRREIFDKVMFDESFFRHQEIEFLANFYRHFKMAICPHFLVSMQVEGMRNYPNRDKVFAIKQKLLEKYKNDISQIPITMQKEICDYQNSELARMKFHNNACYSLAKKTLAVILGLTKYRRFMNLEKYWENA